MRIENVDPAIFILFGIVYLMCSALILYKVESYLRIIPKTKCIFKKHTFKDKYGQAHKKCVWCGQIKNRPHLRVINGGKF